MTNALTASGLFGELFCDPAVAAAFSAPAFTRRMLAFEAAWTRALHTHRVVRAEEAEAALAAIAQFPASDLGEGPETGLAQASNRDGLPVPGLVAALKQGLSAPQARAIHTGATSQDVIDTAMMLTCGSVLEMFETRLTHLLRHLDDLEQRFGPAPLMARTRMQAALPTVAAVRIQAWRRPLADHLARAEAVRHDLNVVQIGGPIGARDTPQAFVMDCAATVAADLGLALAPVWHSDRSRIVGFGHWITLVAGTLGKIGQDIALMAQQGVGDISLGGGGGSSAMPHKQNPIAAEAMVTLARYIAGQQGILAQAMIHEQERSGSAWALEWLTLPAMAEGLGASLAHAETLLGSVTRIGTPAQP